MKKHEIIRFNAPLLRQMYKAGINVLDVQKLDIYEAYKEIAQVKKEGVALTVAEARGISERHVNRIVREMERDVEV